MLLQLYYGQISFIVFVCIAIEPVWLLIVQLAR